MALWSAQHVDVLTEDSQKKEQMKKLTESRLMLFSLNTDPATDPAIMEVHPEIGLYEGQFVTIDKKGYPVPLSPGLPVLGISGNKYIPDKESYASSKIHIYHRGEFGLLLSKKDLKMFHVLEDVYISTRGTISWYGPHYSRIGRMTGTFTDQVPGFQQNVSTGIRFIFEPGGVMPAEIPE